MGTADPAERALYQGLIKLAAAFVHAVRGNPLGLARNLTGARSYLAAASAAGLDGGLDLETLVASLDERLAAVAALPPLPGREPGSPRFGGRSPLSVRPPVLRPRTDGLPRPTARGYSRLDGPPWPSPRRGMASMVKIRRVPDPAVMDGRKRQPRELSPAALERQQQQRQFKRLVGQLSGPDDVFEVSLGADEKAVTIRQRLLKVAADAGVEIAVRKHGDGFLVGLMTPERRSNRGRRRASA